MKTSLLFQAFQIVPLPRQMGSSALLNLSINVPLRPSPMHLERDRMANIRNDVLSSTPERPNKLLRERLRTRSPKVHGRENQARTDRPEVDVHERDRFLIVGIEPLVRVEAWNEFAYVCFGGYVERDSWHLRFVAGRTHECYEHRTGASCVPKRR